MGEVMSGPDLGDRYGHDYSAGYQSCEGYGVCCNCGALESSNRSVRECPNPLGSDDPAAYIKALEAIADRVRVSHRGCSANDLGICWTCPALADIDAAMAGEGEGDGGA